MGRESEIAEADSSSSPSSSYSPSQAVDVLSSLISFSHSIKVFPVKWQTIRHKLHELNASLLAIVNCDSESNPILAAVLAGITATAGDCYDLAKRCVDASFSGKLLMQSDLDVLASRFDRHLGNLSGICNSGVLTHGFAIVVSRPRVSSSSKEDLRFYARDCLTRMKIGDSEMKKEAIVNLNEAVEEDEKYVRVIVELGEIVTNLVKLLECSDSSIQEEAAKLVVSISGFDSYKQILVGAGVIGPVIRVLEGGSELGKIMSARCLMKLTQNSDNAWSVSAHGGVSALLKLCSNHPSSPELIAPATSVLKNLAAVEEIKRFMVEDGAVSTFVKLIGAKEEAIQIIAIDFLQFIASQNGTVSTIGELVVRQGGIRVLVRVLDPVSSSSPRSREAALMAIENLCFNSPHCNNLISNSNFINSLLHHLKSAEFSLKELTLKVSCRLSATSDAAKRAMGDAGFTPELIKFLAAKSTDVREMAGEAIVGLLTIPRNRKRFLQDESSIGFVLELINNDELGNSYNNKFLVAILMAVVTNSNSWRRKILGSGYLKNVEKIAESEGLEGKKLLKRLGSGRIRNMINRVKSEIESVRL
ncbi:U-box domain-containing protein 4 [Linum perenne]